MTATHGEGVYGNAVGVTTPTDHKMAQVAEWVKTAANTIRAGLLWDGNATIVSGKANMSYDVRAFSIVTSRGATSGAVKWANDAVLNLTKDITGANLVAPGSNSAYHLVFAWHREYSLDGTDSNPVIGVIQGTAAASPSVPSLSAYPGAVELARILVPAGTTATNSGTTITQTAPFTAASGGVVAVRNTTERDAGSWIEGQLVELLDSHVLQQYSGSGWNVVGGDTGWVNVTFTNSWANVSGFTTSYRRLNGVVYIRGRIQSGTANSVAFTLPAGFRPAIQSRFGQVDGSAATAVTVLVDSTGGVTASGTTPNLGLSFIAEA